jgi:Protein of unknown function (DUF3467)
MSQTDPFFANHFSIGYNDEEFLLQFGRMYVGQNDPAVVFTVITTPGYARRLRDLLNESIDRYNLEHLPSGPVTQ